jgi:hypothetical protein
MTAQLAADREAIEVGQIEIEDQKIDAALLHGRATLRGRCDTSTRRSPRARDSRGIVKAMSASSSINGDAQLLYGHTKAVAAATAPKRRSHGGVTQRAPTTQVPRYAQPC